MQDENTGEETSENQSTEAIDETVATAETTDAETPVVAAEAEAEKDEAGKPKEEPAKPAEIPEETLKAAAQKYANRTMAAARRAESAAKALSTENATLKTSLDTHTAFVKELQENPFAAIRRLGFKSIKEFVQKGIDHGEEPKAPTADDRVTQLEKMLSERDEKAKADAHATAVAEGQRNVFAAVDKLTDKYDFATTEIGHDQLWDGIMEYHRLHGECPDAAVFALADEVEKTLSVKFANVRKLRQDPGAKTGQTATGKAGTVARGSGKTLTGSATSGSPGKREYSLDADERRKQVVEDMRAAGEL